MKAKKDIKVLYFTHPCAFNIYGGAEIQILKTKMYLEKTGNCSIKLFDVFYDKFDDYDMLHIFQMDSALLSLFDLAKHKGLKTVLSPIWWESPPIPSFFAKIGPAALARFYLNWKVYRIPTSLELDPFKRFLDLADIILPSSRMEISFLSRRFRVDPGKFFVVPNGVDERFAKAKPDLFVEKYGVRDFILYVGKIERNKNSLSLVKVCKDIGIPTIIIGDPQPLEEEYYAKCKRMAESSHNVQFIGSLAHDSDELASAYAAAKVFVLPSWHEVASLSALEAGLAGCNLVLTQRSSAPEYFKESAVYVNPASIADIRNKILVAYDKPKNNQIKEHVLSNFTWEKVAERTLEAYRLVLGQN
jgi:glycosyltransferase involved in cell wall biosynthesis